MGVVKAGQLTMLDQTNRGMGARDNFCEKASMLSVGEGEAGDHAGPNQQSWVLAAVFATRRQCCQWGREEAGELHAGPNQQSWALATNFATWQHCRKTIGRHCYFKALKR